MRSGLMTEKSELMTPGLETHQAATSTSWQWAALGAILLGSCGHLLIKAGVTAAAHNAPAAGTLSRIIQYLLQPAAIGGLAVYGAGTLLWIYAVSQRNISFLYPLTALTYVIVALGGKFVFFEVISLGRWLGIVVVMLGVGLLQLSARGDAV